MESIEYKRQVILENIKNSVATKKQELMSLEADAEEINKRLKDAIDAKDLSENSAYEIAVAESQRNSKQRALVKSFIDSYDDFAKISENQGRSARIRIGSAFKIKILGNNEEYIFVMVKDSIADGSIGALSELSYPGKVLMGRAVGETVVVRTAVTTYQCTVLEVY